MRNVMLRIRLSFLLCVVAATGAMLVGCDEIEGYTVSGMVTAAAGGEAVAGIKVTCQVEGGEPGEAISAGAEEGDDADAGSEDAEAAEPGSYTCVAPLPADAPNPATVEVTFVDEDSAENGGEFAEHAESIDVALGGEESLDVTLEPL